MDSGEFLVPTASSDLADIMGYAEVRHACTEVTLPVAVTTVFGAPAIPEFQTVKIDHIDPEPVLSDGAMTPDQLERMLSDLGLGSEINGARKRLASVLPEYGHTGLRKLRLAAGLSQEELARRIGSTQPHVSRLESAKSRENPGLETLRRLASALGCDFNTLIAAMPRG